MRPLTFSEIRGNWATVLLPITSDDQIDMGRLTDELDHIIAAGVDGLYTNGTAGEFYNQSVAEFMAVSELVAARCEAAKLPFQLGAGDPNPRVTLDRVGIAARLAPSAIQVVLPDWFPVTDSEAVEFLQRLAESADPIGLVLYNPPHAKRVLTPTELGRLAAAVPGLVGVKVADGDDDWYADMRAQMGTLSVFVPGHHLATGIANGAAGSYSNVACLSPAGAQRWADLMQSDLAAALAIEQRVRAFMTTHIQPFISEQGYANQAVDKLLAAIGDWAPVGPRLRWPYRWIDPAEAERLRPIAQAEMPEFFTV